MPTGKRSHTDWSTHERLGASLEPVRIRLIDGFEVSVGSRNITRDAWRLKKAAALVKLLALAPGHRMHREQVMDLLWPDSGRRAASNSLRSVLYATRKVLDPDAGARYLASEGESLVLCPGGDLWVDVDAFEAAVAAARRSGHPAAYRAAIGLCAGELLPDDRYEEWVESRRRELRGAFLSVLIELAGLYEGRGDYRRGVETLQRFLSVEPTDEEAHARLMRLHAHSGRGVRFENARGVVNLCCPDRVSMLTGEYVHNHGIYDNLDGSRFGTEGLDRETFATWLHRAGYRTAYFGKYLNEYKSLGIPPGWDRWYAYNGGLLPPYPINDQGAQTYLGADQEQEADHLGRKSVEWLKNTSGSGTPRLLVLAPRTPHAPVRVADRYAGTYSNISMPKPPSFNQANVSDKPSVIRKKPLLTSSEVGAMQTEFRSRMEALRSVDDAVNGILNELIDEGELGNIYIIYASDNGWFWGGHRLTLKTFPYDEGVRLPFVVRGPGVQAGARISHLMGTHDLAPTIADLANATPGGTQDGKSFVPLLSSSRPPADTWRSRLLVESWTSQGKFYAFRSNGHLYAEHHETSAVEREHYDLRTDPYELRNDAKSLSLATRKRFHESLVALKNCSGNSCRTAEGS